jgi:hypothetical protein
MPVTTGKYGPLVGAIDEGTSSARFLVSTNFILFLIIIIPMTRTVRINIMITENLTECMRASSSSHLQRYSVILIVAQYSTYLLASETYSCM